MAQIERSEAHLCNQLLIFSSQLTNVANTAKIFVTRSHTKSTFRRQRLHQQPTHSLITHYSAIMPLIRCQHPVVCQRWMSWDRPAALLEKLYPTDVAGALADLEIKFYLLLFQIRVASGHGCRFVFPFSPVPAKGKGSTLQCPSVGIHLRQKRWLSVITDHPSDHWSLLADDRWSHNDHSERLCAVGAAGQGDFYLLTGHEAGYLTWNYFDDQARLTPQPNLLLENVASGRILGSWGALRIPRLRTRVPGSPEQTPFTHHHCISVSPKTGKIKKRRKWRRRKNYFQNVSLKASKIQIMSC